MASRLPSESGGSGDWGLGTGGLGTGALKVTGKWLKVYIVPVCAAHNLVKQHFTVGVRLNGASSSTHIHRHSFMSTFNLL